MQNDLLSSSSDRKTNYLEILKSAPIAIYEVEFPGTRFRFVNEKLCQILGYSERELLALNPNDLLFEEGRIVVQQKINEVLRGQSPSSTSAEIRVKTKNGQDLWGLITARVNFKLDKPDSILIFALDITERKRVEEALHLSEEKFAKTFLNSPYAVTLTRLSDGSVIDANEAAVSLFGYSLEEVAGKDTLRFWADTNDRPKFISEVYSRGVISNKEIMFRKKDGSHFLVNFSGSIIIIKEEKCLLATFIDITEDKKAEEALKQSEQLYRTLFDNSEDGFALVQPIFDSRGEAYDLSIVSVNKVYEKISGDIAKDLIGKTTSDYVPDLNKEIIITAGEVAKSGKSRNIEIYDSYTCKWYSCYCFVYNQNQIGILFRDISEHKIAEEALRESKNKYQALIETTSDFIWEMDVNGTYTYCSPQMEKLWGIKPSEMIGKTPFDLMPVLAKERAYAAFTAIARDPKPFVLELPALDGQKNLVLLEIKGVPFFDRQDRLVGFRGISRDITERKNLERQLQDNERMAAIGQTAGMVGHDIRNPLQAIVGDLYLLKSDIDLITQTANKESLIESIENIEKNVAYINKIVADLQDYARPLKPEYTKIDIGEFLSNVSKDVWISKEITVQISANTFKKISSDPTFIRRILHNLTNNAIQAMPNGGNLDLGFFAKNNKVYITVADTGSGIPDDIKPKLFTPMMTTKSKGQGLGLAVVKRLVEALNGNISFESEVGKGTKFTIELPA